MKENVVKDKSFAFALRIIKMYKFLVEHKEYVLSKQVLRSGTSIGANIEEANSAQSKKDFIAKISISLKEAKETHYWLRLLHGSNYINELMFNSILTDCEEIIALLTTIIKSSRKNINE
ncbi:MAG: four helix bundle protein [Prevotellaceae bacterium]|jgi:four helix bundle protein|nr:four helix bundle protein [Prevotellaceae bacterium]